MDREQDTLRTDRRTQADGRSSDAILRDIERTRGAMDETLEELGDRLHPRQLLDDAIDLFRSDSVAGKSFRRNTRRWGRRAMDEVRDNPMPALLIGAGLAWMAFGSRHDDDDEAYYYESRAEFEGPGFGPMPGEGFDDAEYAESDYGPDYGMDTVVGSCPTGIEGDEPMGDEIAEAITSHAPNRDVDRIGRDEEGAHGRLRRAGQSARDKAREAGQATREKASEAGDRLRSGASKVKNKVKHAGSAVRSKSSRGIHRTGERMHELRENASDMGYRARQRGRRMRQRAGASMRENYDYARDYASEAVDEYPMAVAAGAVAMGVIAGILMPRTAHEDEWLGEQSDALKETAKSVAGESVERAKETAVASAAAAANTMEEEGLAPDQLVEKASRVAREASESAKEALKEESLTRQDLKEKLQHVGEEAKQTAKSEADKHREAMSEEFRT